MRVFEGLHREGGSLHALGPRGQVSAHRHTIGIGLLDELLVAREVIRVVPAAEEAQTNQGPRGSVGLFSLHGVEDRGPSVLLGPDGRCARRPDDRGRYTTCVRLRVEPDLGGVVGHSVSAVPVELLVPGVPRMHIRTGDDAVLERIGSELRFVNQTGGQRLANEAMFDLADRRCADEVRKHLEIRELIVG